MNKRIFEYKIYLLDIDCITIKQQKQDQKTNQYKQKFTSVGANSDIYWDYEVLL